jgi:hypothetical protein
MAGRHGRCLTALAVLVLTGAPAFAQSTDVLFADSFEARTATFRINDLDLRDPHLFLPVVACKDVTEVGFSSVSFNTNLQLSLQNDLNEDGLLDVSYIVRLRPVDQADGATGEFALGTARCSAPLATTSCQADGSVLAASAYTSRIGVTCLAPPPGSTGSYVPAVEPSLEPCFVTSPFTLTLNLAGMALPLRDVTVAATWFGSPLPGLANGLLAGFLTETDADALTIPESIPLLAGFSLSSVLPGGASSCAPHSDKDVHDGVAGWWFFLNFAAMPVGYGG